MNNVDLLRKKAFEGLEEKGLADSQKYIDRLNYELGVVEKEGFTPYFLVLWDIAKYARENGIIYGPGRGSGSGSLLNYCLRITLVDPLKYDLLFERFLNPDRVSPPDIDWDVADRDKIIEYIEKRYGRDRVARVGTINFLRTRSAIRDVGRVLGKERKFIDELAGMVPPPIAGLWDTFEKECEREPKLLNSEYADIIGPVGRLWSVARSYGTHAGGIAIAPGPINTFVPLYKDKDGNPVCQFDWRDLETAGLLKFDILGVKGLRVIQLCIDYLKEDEIDMDVTLLEDGDEETYELICKGDLDGVFQLGGSESIKQLTVNILPRDINDISLVSALFRPGPIISGMLSKAVEARQGKKAASYIHPSLEPILKDTYGVCIYQEQAMRIAVDLAGFSGGESDILRKVIGKKLKEKMAEQEEKLVSGMVRNGIPKKAATGISDMIKGSAQYSFNRGHSIAYSIITYWQAYLKAHYPVHFYSALLACEENPNRIIQYASSIRDAGIDILLPDVNLSGIEHRPEGDSIRFGLNSIKGMPSATAQKIIEVRKDIGCFSSTQELIEKTGANAKAAECLGLSGALSTIEEEMNEEEAAQYAKKMTEYVRNMERFVERTASYEERVETKRAAYREALAKREARERERRQAYDEKVAKYREKLAEVEEKNRIRTEQEKKLLKIPKEPAPPKPLKPLSELKLPVAPIAPIFPSPLDIPVTQAERIRKQREILNFYVSGHPLDEVKEKEGVTKIKDLGDARKNSRIVLRGVIQTLKIITTRTNSMMAKARFEDRTGSIEVVIFPRDYQPLKGKLLEGELYEVIGKSDVTTVYDYNTGEERSHLQFIGMKISPIILQGRKDWNIIYPLLKGSIKISPGNTEKSEAVASMVISQQIQKVFEETGE